MLARAIRTAAILYMAAPSPALAWDEREALAYILDHHPVLQAQRDAAAAEKLLDRLPMIEAMLGERRQAAANVEMAEANAARVREAATERKQAAESALATAATDRERTAAAQTLRTVATVAASDVENADAALEKTRVAADHEDYGLKRRYALAELGQLRRRWSDKAARRLDAETKAGEIRQTALGGLAKLRELEAERIAVDSRLGFLKSKSGWLQKQVAQGQPESDLWENAQRQTAETATLKRLDLLIESQRQQAAHLAGDRWEWLYRYLSGAAK